MIDVTKPGMVAGVQNAAAFLLVLTKSVFTRPFCRLEIITAIKAGKPVITVMETDGRFAAFDFASKTTDVPRGFCPIVEKICSDICAIPIRRDREERELMMHKIAASYTTGKAKVVDFLTLTITLALALTLTLIGRFSTSQLRS